jgi:hypothetical protein
MRLHGRSQRVNPLWKWRMTLDAIMEKIHSPNILVDGYGYQSGKSSDRIKVKAKR